MKVLPAFFADWANGIFAVLLAGYLTGTEVLWWHFIIGLVFAQLIDIDALPELWRRGRLAASAENVHDHRDGLHYPLFVVPVLVVTAFLIGYWGWVLCFAVSLHLLNDLYGTGWGLKALWPFSRSNYKFLARRANYLKSHLHETSEWDRLTPDERRLRFLVVWSEEELPDYLRHWGIESWVERYYWRRNWVMAVEYALFVAALGAAILSLVN